MTRHMLVNDAARRRYDFLSYTDTVRVLRWTGGTCRESKLYNTDAARRLWAWLLKLGYRKW